MTCTNILYFLLLKIVKMELFPCQSLYPFVSKHFPCSFFFEEGVVFDAIIIICFGSVFYSVNVFTVLFLHILNIFLVLQYFREGLCLMQFITFLRFGFIFQASS